MFPFSIIISGKLCPHPLIITFYCIFKLQISSITKKGFLCFDLGKFSDRHILTHFLLLYRYPLFVNYCNIIYITLDRNKYICQCRYVANLKGTQHCTGTAQYRTTCSAYSQLFLHSYPGSRTPAASTPGHTLTDEALP